MKVRNVTTNVSAVVIGASTGGIEALQQIFRFMENEFTLAVIVVIHLPPSGKSMLPSLFEGYRFKQVKEAEDKEKIEAGTLYFAPHNYHLLIESDSTFSLSSDEPVSFARPSIDVLFESATDAFGDQLIGIVLSGANEDGAKGVHAICKAGGIVLVQEPSSAVASAMPLAGAAACAEAKQMSPVAIGSYLNKLGVTAYAAK